MSLGNRIRSVRKEAGLSQEELARRAGISLNAVRHIEQRGQTDPHYSTLDKLSKVLDMSVDELMGAVVAGKAEAPEEGTGPATTEEMPPNTTQMSEADRQCLSDILDPLTGELQRLRDTYRPHLGLLSTGPPPANASPDDPPPKRLSETFAWLTTFRITCMYVESMVDGLASSKTVSLWLSRMNDPATPIDIGQKLHDFENAREELFDNLEPFAAAWMDANREYLSDEERAELSAKFGYSPGERATPRRGRS